MDADTLQEAITTEMLDFRRTKQLATSSAATYTLRPVTHSNNSSSVLSNRDSVPPASLDQLELATASGRVSGVDEGAKLKVPPGISTGKVDADGNSVEMPSATSSGPNKPSDDVTMLSARTAADNTDVDHRPDINADSERWTDSTEVANNSATECESDNHRQLKPLAVNTSAPLEDDAKARIKAALLSSGRRRQRRGKAEIVHLPVV